MELIRDNVKVEWAALGEGLNGDYDPKDPNDMELLRFDVSVFRDGQWEAKENGSYCTCFPASATEAEKIAGLEVLMNRFHPVLHENMDASIKKLGEEMSWIALDAISNHLFVPSVSEEYEIPPEPLKPSLMSQIQDAMSRLPNKTAEDSVTHSSYEHSL